ncbi:putative ribonuclease H-like domain-containing protein [Tanacetum coccineum]
MTGNKAYLDEFQDFNGGHVAFGGSKGYITSKGKIKTRKLDFEDVCFVKELQHFNLFSVSQMCDKRTWFSVYWTLKCLVLRIGLFNCKGTADESNKWHRRLGHVNFKNLNKLVKGNLVRGLPSKLFQNDHTCVACLKEAIVQSGVYLKTRRMNEAVVVRNKARFVAQGHCLGLIYGFVVYSKHGMRKVAFLYGRKLSYEEFVMVLVSVHSKDFPLSVVKENFRLPKGQNPKTGKSTTGGCQFLRRRLIFWQYKKQTIVATFKYRRQKNVMLAASCSWLSFVDSEIKELIQVLKSTLIDNVADLLTKAFDVSGSVLVSTTFVEQFWTSAKSKTINNVRHITAKVAGKSVSISEASIRSDLLFDDADGIDSLPNQAIFDAIQLMGKVFSFMVKKGKYFSGKVTPLFATMLVQPTQDEGVSSERSSKAQPTLPLFPLVKLIIEPQTDSSPAQTSEVPIEHQSNLSPRPSPTTNIPGSIPESSGENLGGHSSSDKSLSGNEDEMTIQSVYDICLSLCKQVSDQAKEIQALKAQITKLKKQAKPVIKHHRAYLKSVSVKQRFPRKSFSKKHKVHKESVSKQGRKFAKGESSVQRDPLFDEMPEDTVDHMDTENAQDEGRTGGQFSTDRPIVSTDGSKVSTDRQIEGTDEQVEGTEEHNEGTEEKNEDQTEEDNCYSTLRTTTQTPNFLSIFGDDENNRLRIESESESDGIPEAEKKFKQLKSDEEMARKIQEEWEAEEERNRIAEENAANEDLIRDFDDIKAMIEADRLLAEKLQE